MDNANNIFERKNLDGSIDYVVTLGSFFYNNKIVSLSNVVIPIRQQSFFDLPSEKRFYAAVNVYYSVIDGIFVFDTVKKSERYIDSCDSDAITNLLPIGQFILQQSLARFEVKKINLYSKMATFSITDSFVQGDQGAQGPMGNTGFVGYTGLQGYTGNVGLVGDTGVRGYTGVGDQGYTGQQGATGVYPDLGLLVYYKFKTDDVYLTDYSVYERDLEWGATGAGVTGIVWIGYTATETGIELIDQGQSSYTLEDGIVDMCHSIVHKGGISGYFNNKYVGFTGTIQAWVNIDQPPIADFIYEQKSYTGMIGYPVRFTDASLFYPTSTEWEIEGNVYNAGIITHSFGAPGEYLIKLTASNLSGLHTKYELITVV